MLQMCVAEDEQHAAGCAGTLEMMAEEESKHHEEIAQLATAALQSEELQFDPSARVAEGDDNGAYVQAWAWFSFSGTKFDKSRNVNAAPALAPVNHAVVEQDQPST
jgi:hypothetical protein